MSTSEIIIVVWCVSILASFGILEVTWDGTDLGEWDGWAWVGFASMVVLGPIVLLCIIYAVWSEYKGIVNAFFTKTRRFK